MLSVIVHFILVSVRQHFFFYEGRFFWSQFFFVVVVLSYFVVLGNKHEAQSYC